MLRQDIQSARANRLSNGIYHIINVLTGTYVALLNDDDRSEVVNIIFGLRDDDNRGSKVNNPLLTATKRSLQGDSG